jgi:hypothetical protein
MENMMKTIPNEIKDKILERPLYSQSAVAAMLDISVQTLEKGRQGRVNYLKKLKFTKIGRRILYPAQSIIEYIDSLNMLETVATKIQD